MSRSEFNKLLKEINCIEDILEIENLEEFSIKTDEVDFKVEKVNICE